MSDAVVVPPRPAGAAAGESLLGRHICVSRVGYTHHGILSSATGETVVHYAKGSGALDGVIREESFARFLGASPLTAVAYVEDDAGRPAKFTREEIVARARHCIGLADYGLFGSNCEHWARWVEIDESYSKQVSVRRRRERELSAEQQGWHESHVLTVCFLRCLHVSPHTLRFTPTASFSPRSASSPASSALWASWPARCSCDNPDTGDQRRARSPINFQLHFQALKFVTSSSRQTAGAASRNFSPVAARDEDPSKRLTAPGVARGKVSVYADHEHMHAYGEQWRKRGMNPLAGEGHQAWSTKRAGWWKTQIRPFLFILVFVLIFTFIVGYRANTSRNHAAYTQSGQEWVSCLISTLGDVATCGTKPTVTPNFGLWFLLLLAGSAPRTLQLDRDHLGS